MVDAFIGFIYEEDPRQIFGDITAQDGSYSVLLSPVTAVEETETGVEETAAVELPRRFQLFQNYPNPFNPTTLIRYTLEEPGQVELAIYNMLGHRIRTLEDSYQGAGEFVVAWDGRDENGMGVSAGVYLYRLRSGGLEAAGKMTLIDGAVGRGVGARSSKLEKIAEPTQDSQRYTVWITGGDIEDYQQVGTIIPEEGILDFTVVRRNNSAVSASTPERLMDNLILAMGNRDKELYETVLDQNFWFTETDCQGELVFFNGNEEELEIITGSRDGTRAGIFDVFRTFEFEFELSERSTELGSDYPDAFEGDPDGHPDEDWEVFRGRVEMLMIDENGDGFRVSQIMNFKLRQDGEGVWRMVRWVDDPLSGDCGAGKILAEATSWGRIKAGFR